MKNTKQFVLLAGLALTFSAHSFASSCDDAAESAITEAKEIHQAKDKESAEYRLKVSVEMAKLACKMEGIASVGTGQQGGLTIRVDK